MRVIGSEDHVRVREEAQDEHRRGIFGIDEEEVI